MGSFGFVGFIRVRPGCYRVHSDSLGSFGHAIGVDEFIRVRSGSCVSLGYIGFISLRVVMFMKVGWVHSGAPRGALRCSLGVVGFNRVNSEAPWRSSGSLGFIRAP